MNAASNARPARAGRLTQLSRMPEQGVHTRLWEAVGAQP